MNAYNDERAEELRAMTRSARLGMDLDLPDWHRTVRARFDFYMHFSWKRRVRQA
jgi:hypothetical protein